MHNAISDLVEKKVTAVVVVDDVDTDTDSDDWSLITVAAD